MATAHLMHGFVGVGKTTFSKKLEREINAVRLSPDEWMIALYGPNPPADIFRDAEDRVIALIWATAAKVLAAGVDVIFDFGFWKRAARDAAKARLSAIGANVILYHLTCPDEVMVARVLKRTADQEEGALMIDLNAINEFRARFEPATEDENAVLINTAAE